MITLHCLAWLERSLSWSYERERERERERVNRLEEKLELGADFCVNVKTCSRIVQTDCTDPDLAALLTTL